MRCDGDIVIFVLQGRSTEKGKKKEWFGPSFDYFGHPPGFQASDDCWQRTGIFGTFDEDEGLTALKLFNREHVEYDWRLMRLHVVQEHTEVACFQAKTPRKKPPEAHSYPEASDYELRRRARAVAGLKD